MKVLFMRYNIHLFIIVLVTFLGLVWLPFQAFGDQSEFVGGDGTEENPYLIANGNQLNNVRNHLNAHFKLIEDIDLDITPFNQGSGWEPIGSFQEPFKGTFDGNGYKIKNLFINRSNENYIGLFAAISEGSVLRNVALENVEVMGRYVVGGLVGSNNKGNITDSYVDGTISGNFSVGGLVGESYLGFITSSYVMGEVIDNDDGFVGGLVGYDTESTITNSYTTATVSGSGYVGGLVGWMMNGKIIDAYSTGNVDGKSDVGGLIGMIEQCEITDSYATGNVSSETYSAGGLVGYSNNSTIINTYATGSVSGAIYYVGGLMGVSKGDTITNAYATGPVSGADYVGGLMGFSNNDTITNAYATGPVSGADYVGGLIGNFSLGTVTHCYSMGAVSGSKIVGGLVGWIGRGNDATITQCFTTGTVSGTENVGGLAGRNEGAIINNSYATGAVTGTTAVSGLVGWNEGNITNSYSIGIVLGDNDVGGLVGINENGSITNSYYDKDTSSQDDTGKGEPKTTDEMKQRITFEGWDFDNVWRILEKQSYPRLQWEDYSSLSVALEESGTKTAGKVFNLNITEAKDIFGFVINGDLEITVSSDQSGVVFKDFVTFHDGNATVPIKLNTRGTHSLDIQVEGITKLKSVSVDVIVRSTGGGGNSRGSDQGKSSELFIDIDGSIRIPPSELDITKPSVKLQVDPQNKGTAYVSIPATILTDFAKENAQFVIEIESPFGSYLLPVTLPSLISDWEKLLEENNWQAENIGFKLTLTDKTENSEILENLSIQLPNGKLVGSILNVHLEMVDIKTGEVLTAVNEFTEPIIRMITISEKLTVDSTTWGAFRYDDESGKFVFVPARLEERDGRLYAVIRSYSNSVYVAVSNAVSFTDMKRHWAKADVERAGAKGLVFGTGNGKFTPDKMVTRAEFTALLVRAIGPAANNNSDKPVYKDVQQGAWYYDVVAQAKELGILDFIEAERFLPNQPLTREEMARMVATAVRLKMQNLPKKSVNLNSYRDRADMDEAYIEDIELMVRLGIMNGTKVDHFSPKGKTTRAQAAVVLLRTLKVMDWID